MFIVPVPPEVPVGGTLPQKLVTGPPVTARARPQSSGSARRVNCAARRTSYGDRFSYGRWACEAGSTESTRPVRRRRDTQSTGRALICFQMGEDADANLPECTDQRSACEMCQLPRCLSALVGARLAVSPK